MELNYKKLGNGQPIIILHGFLGTLDNWITIGRRLEENFEVYLVDQRNHGFSPKSDSHSMEDMASDLHEFVQTHNLHNPVLMGHSMGGKVIMQYSAMYKDAFDKLIVVDIAPKYYKPHHQELFDALNSLDLNNISSRNEADEQLKNKIPNDGVRLFLLKNLDRTKEGFAWKANLHVLEKSQKEVGEPIFGSNLTDRPVYFIRGEESSYVLKEDRSAIKELYPGAQIMTIKGAGHWVHAEQPDAFYQTLNLIL